MGLCEIILMPIRQRFNSEHKTLKYPDVLPLMPADLQEKNAT